MKRQNYNKWLILILIIAILIPNFLFNSNKEVTAAQTGTVTATTLNVRSKASTTSPKVQLNGSDVYLVKDETVNIIEESGDFYYVSLKFNGKTVKGYVHKNYIKVSKPKATPTPTPKATATPKPTSSPKPTATPKPGSTVDVIKKVELPATVTASTLNVRSGPGTGYSKVGGLIKGSTVTVLDGKMTDNVWWYGITFKQGGKSVTGYVSSDYIKLTYKSSVKGEIYAKSAKIRAKAGSEAAYLKYTSGKVVTLKKGKNVTITNETTLAGVKWFKVTFTVSSKKYTGYVEANKTNFRTTVKATATPTPTSKPTPTPTPTSKPTPTPKPTTTPVPTVTPTPTPIPTASALVPTISPSGMFEVDNSIQPDTITSPMTGYVCNTVYLNVYDYEDNIITNMMDDNQIPVTLLSAQEVTVTQLQLIAGVRFYMVDFSNNGVNRTGYVLADYIYIHTTSSETAPSPTPVANLDFEASLTQENFPESYKQELRKLHEVYPNWVFKAYHTGLDWNTVIANESVPAKNLIPNSKSVEWKSLEPKAYSWEKDSFNVIDGKTWVTASKAAIEYYMDPRNFINTSGIFQFELLKYQSAYQTVAGVENILKGTAMYNTSYSFIDEAGKKQTYTYGETFIKAAQYSGVSPYHLASRVKQEVVTGATTLSGSVTGTYSGYEGYYNFYNIGATHSAGGGAIANGLKYAKNGSGNAATDLLYKLPWTNQYLSIVGGSSFLGKSYISKGQDTIYLQKFNVTPTSTYFHQYMSNVEAPFAESKKIITAYSTMTDTPIVFSIPVYLNMPEKAIPVPGKMYNPNNRMASLKVTNAGKELPLTPTFSQTVYSYDLIVDNSVSTVDILATAVSNKAKVSDTGTKTLQVGENKFVIPVTAENGDVANYTITIIRAQ